MIDNLYGTQFCHLSKTARNYGFLALLIAYNFADVLHNESENR